MSGSEAALLAAALAVSAAGTGLTLSAQASANKRRRSEIARAREISDAASKKQSKVTLEAARDLDPTLREKRREDVINNLSKIYTDQIFKDRTNAVDVNVSGNVSDDFTRAKARSAAARAASSARLAQLMARVQGPQQLFNDERARQEDFQVKKALIQDDTDARLRYLQAGLGAIQPSDAGMIAGESLKTLGSIGALYAPRSSSKK